MTTSLSKRYNVENLTCPPAGYFCFPEQPSCWVSSETPCCSGLSQRVENGGLASCLRSAGVNQPSTSDAVRGWAGERKRGGKKPSPVSLRTKETLISFRQLSCVRKWKLWIRSQFLLFFCRPSLCASVSIAERVYVKVPLTESRNKTGRMKDSKEE